MTIKYLSEHNKLLTLALWPQILFPQLHFKRPINCRPQKISTRGLEWSKSSLCWMLMGIRLAGQRTATQGHKAHTTVVLAATKCMDVMWLVCKIIYFIYFFVFSSIFNKNTEQKWCIFLKLCLILWRFHWILLCHKQHFYFPYFLHFS